MKRITAAALLATALCAPINSRASSYVLTDFGSIFPGNTMSYANDINSQGEVVGTISPGAHAFLWSPSLPNGTSGTMIDLGGGVSNATGINSYGQVVGCTGTYNCSSLDQMITTSPVSMLWTPNAPNSTTGSWVQIATANAKSAPGGINDLGQVVGTSNTLGVAYLWTPTTPNGSSGSAVSLGDFPGGTNSSIGAKINSRGQVVGTGDAFSANSSAFIWSPTTPNSNTGSMLAVKSGGEVNGLGINDIGQMVGWPDTSGKGFLWTPTLPNGSTGSAVAIGAPSGTGSPLVRDINSQGDIVGTIHGSGGASSIAVLWTPNSANGTSGTTVALNSFLSAADAAKWQLLDATAINDRGQIVGSGLYDPDGPGGASANFRAFLLTPVPEPTSLGCLATLAACLISTARFARRA
jgi:hypothetical protein